jgi:hypothetical protein
LHLSDEYTVPWIVDGNAGGFFYSDADAPLNLSSFEVDAPDSGAGLSMDAHGTADVGGEAEQAQINSYGTNGLHLRVNGDALHVLFGSFPKVETWKFTSAGHLTSVGAGRNLTASGILTLGSSAIASSNSTGNLLISALTGTSANLATALSDETGSGAAVFGTSPTLTTPALGTPSALVLTNATGLPVAGGGTGLATLTSGAVYKGNGTSAMAVSAISESGGATVINNGSNAVSPLVVQDNGVAAFSVIDNASTVADGITVQGSTTAASNAAGPIIAPAGSDTDVSMTLATKGSGGITLRVNASDRASETGTAWSLASGQLLGFSSSSTDPRGTPPDTYVTREGARVWQWGADAATALAYTLKGNDATGSTNAGGALSIQGGNGTSGIANGGALNLDGGAKNSSGTDGAINIGGTRGAINLGAGGGTTTISGPFAYTGALFIAPPVAVSSSASIASTTRVEACTSGASAITRTLPAATGTGRTITMYKADNGAGTCIFGRTGSDTMNGATTRTLSTQYKSDTCYDASSALWICQGDAT